jgi:hypothetical protein
MVILQQRASGEGTFQLGPNPECRENMVRSFYRTPTIAVTTEFQNFALPITRTAPMLSPFTWRMVS